MELLTNQEAEERKASANLLGWVVLVGAVGMTLGLLGQEVSSIQTWEETMTPAFVGKALIHLSVVIGAFLGGKQMPAK